MIALGELHVCNVFVERYQLKISSKLPRVVFDLDFPFVRHIVQNSFVVEETFNAGCSTRQLSSNLLRETMDAFERAVKIDPDNSEYFVKLGIANVSLQKFEEARVAFGNAIELDPNSGNAHYRLGMILFIFFKEREEGIQHFKRALSLNPSAPYAAQIRQLMESGSQ